MGAAVSGARAVGVADLATGGDRLLRAFLSRLQRDGPVSVVRAHEQRILECEPGWRGGRGPVGAPGGDLRRGERDAVCQRGAGVFDAAYRDHPQ